MKLMVLHGYNSGIKSVLPYTKILKQHYPDLDIIIPISSSKRWYDIFETDIWKEDKEGIQYTANKIEEILDELVDSGTQPSDIMIVGFSQGGAIATYVGLTSKHHIKAAIGICSYVPLIFDSHSERHFHKHRHVYLFNGENDRIVKPKYIHKIVENYPYIKHKFYHCGHEICPAMVDDIRKILIS